MTEKYKAQKEWYQRNRESVRQQHKEYRVKNREKIREQSKKYYQKNKDKIMGYAKKYYHTPKGREVRRLVHLKYMNKRKKWLVDYKKDKKCSRCGLGFPEHTNVLEFHHVDGIKHGYEDSPSQLFFRKSPQKFLVEIKKCVIVCANCHRIIHDEEKKDE